MMKEDTKNYIQQFFISNVFALKQNKHYKYFWNTRLMFVLKWTWYKFLFLSRSVVEKSHIWHFRKFRYNNLITYKRKIKKLLMSLWKSNLMRITTNCSMCYINKSFLCYRNESLPFIIVIFCWWILTSFRQCNLTVKFSLHSSIRK